MNKNLILNDSSEGERKGHQINDVEVPQQIQDIANEFVQNLTKDTISNIITLNYNSAYNKRAKKGKSGHYNKRYRQDKKKARLQISDDISDDYLIQSDYEIQSNSVFSTINENNLLGEYDWAIKIIEDILILFHMISKAETIMDYTAAIATFIKLQLNNSLVGTMTNIWTKFTEIFGLNIQSGLGLKDIRMVLDKYQELKNCEIAKKMYKFGTYCLSAALYHKMDVPFIEERYNKIEKEALLKEYNSGPDFLFCMLDTLLFLCERGQQCMLKGNLDPIYHSGTKYEEWCNKALDHTKKVHLLSDPEAHGINFFNYQSELLSFIEQGQCIYQNAVRLGMPERKFVKYVLDELKMCKQKMVTRRSAQQLRAAPMGVLLYGTSGVMKSLLAHVIIQYYGAKYGLDPDPSNIFTRNIDEEYWTGHESHCWCIMVDDIACIKPDVCQGPDPSLKEIIQIVNNISHNPNMADLADKGRCPVKAELAMFTTNVPDINTAYYFSVPFAVQRRLPYVITVRIKDEYKLPQSEMVDATKVPLLEEDKFPDFWELTINKVVPADDKMLRGKLEPIYNTNNIDDFLLKMGTFFDAHKKSQQNFLKSASILRKTTICKNCFKARKVCECETDNYSTKYDETAHEFVVQSNNESLTISDTSQYDTYMWAGLAISWATFTYWYECLLVATVFIFGKFVIFTCSPFLGSFLIYYFSSMIYNILNRISMERRQKILTFILKKMGERVQVKIGMYPKTCSLIAIVIPIIGFYKLNKYINRKEIEYITKNDNEILKNSNINNKDMSTQCTENEIEFETVAVQSRDKISAKIGNAPTAMKEEHYNPWYNDSFELSTFDLSAMTTSYKGLQFTEICNIILNNCAHFNLIQRVDNNIIKRPTKAFCLGGHIYLVNNHWLPDTEHFTVEMIFTTQKEGVNSNLTIMITQSQVTRYNDKDLALINIKNIPPKKNLADLFAKDSMMGEFEGIYLCRNRDGSNGKIIVKHIQPMDKFTVEMPRNIGSVTLDTWFGHADNITINGDCGSILLAKTAFGPVILGIHFIGGVTGKVGAIRIDVDFIKTAMNNIDDMIVQSGYPALSAPSAKRSVGELNKKSLIRYHRKGIANIYGSFTGFRGNHKSKVKPTVICASMLRRGYTLTHGPPRMSSWEPWNNAFQDMINPIVVDQNILDICVKAFTEQIMDQITTEQLATVEIYDNDTAINGAPGIAYVDKINRKTSAGNPWKKCKKYFMKSAEPRGLLLDPIDFDDEIMDRVDDILDKYMKGFRYMPNYCGHLKDEALPLRKIIANKTRVFTGSPVDFVIVVRKYLLSVIRLIQNNKFTFETAVGTVAQSMEWEEIREFLTNFGLSNMIAGDYGKFDKRMSSQIILAAFQVIISICKYANYDKQSLQVVKCISEDVAFPLVDFNGDLVEFFGSNPSGHPLTVIINSFANSLYMRYAFILLFEENFNEFPQIEEYFITEMFIDIRSMERDERRQFILKHFQKFVKLMTYGDDNVLGVNKDIIPWFNHSNIQKALSTIGVEYTMADKEAESVPYIHIDEVSFLKRTWRYDEDVNSYLAPLDHTSINKMLTMVVESNTITREQQAEQVIATAVREYFYYGKTIFEEKVNMLKDVIIENKLEIYVTESTFPSWEHLNYMFWESSKHCKVKRINVPKIANEILSKIDKVKSYSDSYCTVSSSAFRDTSENGSELVNLPGRSPKSVFTDELADSQKRNQSDTAFAGTITQSRQAQTTLNNYNTGLVEPIMQPAAQIGTDLNLLVIQSEDEETDKLLNLSDTQLGFLVRSTWVTGHYIKYKRFLLQHYLAQHKTHVNLLSLTEKKSLVSELIRDIEHINEDIVIKYDNIRIMHSEHEDIGSEDIVLESVEEENQEDIGLPSNIQSQDEHATEVEIDTEAGMTESQVVSFFDQNPGYKMGYDSISDDTMLLGEQPNVELKEFLSRPVLIKTISWSEADTAGLKGSQFYPWHLYFNSTPIKKKLDNYGYINCNLKLKFIVNASPFYYGSMLFSYYPSYTWSDSGAVTVQTDAVLSEIIPFSQRPHVWIYPSTCQGGELTLPFFYHKNWLEATSANNLQNMGVILPYIVNILQSANSAVGQTVTVQIFAWAENVRLAGPTIGLSVQSQDEYGDRPISKRASAFAKIANAFTPIFGNFATATSMAFTSIGNIAHIFGYTNAPNIDTVNSFKNLPFGMFASPEISTPVEKLTLDPKNELTIDSRIAGLDGRDELVISYLAQRESYLTSFQLTTIDAVDAQVFAILVTPNLWNSALSGSFPWINSTPMHYISQLFQYWRGDIIIRFRVVCTPYHKGRFRITYDPVSDITSTVPDYATVFNNVIDYGSEQDIEVRVPYQQAAPWSSVSTSLSGVNFSTIGGLSHTASQDNGMLVVRVVNPLSAPVASNNVYVQVFVRAADNFELAGPQTVPGATVLNIQSQDEVSYNATTKILAGNKIETQHEKLHLVNMGEKVVSLRTLLRRTCYLTSYSIPTNTTDTYARNRHVTSKYPPFKGYTTNGIHSAKGLVATTSNFSYNFVNVTPYHWIAPMFVGQRGAMVYHYNVDSSGTDGVVSCIRLYRNPSTWATNLWSANDGSGVVTTASNAAKQLTAFTSACATGMLLTNANTQTGVSAHLPNYNKYRFHYISPTTSNQGQSVDDSNVDGQRLDIIFKPTSVTKPISSYDVEIYFAIGTDFNFLFFLSCPSYAVIGSPVAN